MNPLSDSCAGMPRFYEICRRILTSHPCAEGSVAVASSPGSADVMGGIVEESGSLVLTTTLATAINAAAWQIAGDEVRILFAGVAAPGASHNGDVLSLHLPLSAFDPAATDSAGVRARCAQAGADWAVPTCLTIRQAIADRLIPMPSGGLAIFLQSDFPAEVDLGKHWVQAAASLEAICRLFQVQADPLQKSRVCAEAVLPLTGLFNLRTPMTALCGPPEGALLQLLFYPQAMCQVLELPPGIIIMAAATRLSRPTTSQRLIETRVCAEMGRCLIAQMQQADGARIDPAAARLAAVTPVEYVERYRDRLPPKMTGQAFMRRFGTLRGLDGEPNPEATYKIRSRAEHHIYENRRAHEFATGIARARRTSSLESLIHAGELMYASHWSHSQRCGIGGVEADRLVSAIRAHGAKAGLFGAKVTAGGQGGELVVLMRDDPRAHDALAEAVARSERASQRPINTFRGPVPGAEVIQPPEMADALSSGASA